MDKSHPAEESDAVPRAQIEQFQSFTAKLFSSKEWSAINQPVIDQFRANDGTVVEGAFKGMPILLLTTIGARTGRPLVSPLGYTRDGDRYVVLASKLGAPAHPAWYHNLATNPVAIVEVGAERFQARASVVDGSERNRLFDAHTTVMPNYADYQRNTTRRIPVVVLDPVP